MIVVYDSGNEIIISTLELEHETLKEYFEEGGRNLDDYDRAVSSKPFHISARMGSYVCLIQEAS